MASDTLTVIIGGIRVEVGLADAARLNDATAMFLAGPAAVRVPELLRRAFPDDGPPRASSRGEDQASLVALFRLMAGLVARTLCVAPMRMNGLRRLTALSRLFAKLCDGIAEEYEGDADDPSEVIHVG